MHRSCLRTIPENSRGIFLNVAENCLFLCIFLRTEILPKIAFMLFRLALRAIEMAQDRSFFSKNWKVNRGLFPLFFSTIFQVMAYHSKEEKFAGSYLVE